MTADPKTKTYGSNNPALTATLSGFVSGDTAAVVSGMRLDVAHHAVDVILVQRRLPGDGHGLLLTRGPVLGRHMNDAVGVDVKCHFDLGNAARRRRQVHQLELAQGLVVHGHLALALKDVDLH